MAYQHNQGLSTSHICTSTGTEHSVLLLSTPSAMSCYLDLDGIMRLLWCSIWYLGPQHREAKHVRGESLNDCGAKLYVQCARRVFGMRFHA